MMMFETSKHVPKTKKRCCVFKNIKIIIDGKTAGGPGVVFDQRDILLEAITLRFQPIRQCMTVL